MKPSRGLQIDYRSLFNHMPDGLAYCRMIFDAKKQPIDFTYLQVNENFTKLTGLKFVTGKKVTELIPGIFLSNPELFEIYGRVALSQNPERFETYVQPLKIWFAISVYSSRKGYFTAIFQNITGRKKVAKDLENAKIAARNVLEDLQVEKEILANEKAKTEAMLASIGDGVIIVDLQKRITFMNQSAQNSLGWKSKEVLGKFLFDVVSVQDEKGAFIPAEKHPINLALTTTTTTTIKHLTYYYVRKDKTKFPVAVTVSPVVLAGKIVGAIEVLRDITREKEVDKAKSEFVSLASHQLKTPPTAIKLLTERMLKGRLGSITKEQKEYLDDISFSNQRMIDIVNTLLNVSHIELGTFSVNLKEMDICMVVKNLLHELAPVFAKKQLKLIEAYQKNSQQILIDEPLFRMIINNIITNAINYSPKASTIQVACKQMPKDTIVGGRVLDQDYMVVTITDIGYGIPKDQQSKLFIKFFRADNARQKQTDGTGLGLYIVKSILDKTGGLVWFQSEENKGTTFYVVIPMTGMKVESK